MSRRMSSEMTAKSSAVKRKSGSFCKELFADIRASFVSQKSDDLEDSPSKYQAISFESSEDEQSQQNQSVQIRPAGSSSKSKPARFPMYSNSDYEPLNISRVGSFASKSLTSSRLPSSAFSKAKRKSLPIKLRSTGTTNTSSLRLRELFYKSPKKMNEQTPEKTIIAESSEDENNIDFEIEDELDNANPELTILEFNSPRRKQNSSSQQLSGQVSDITGTPSSFSSTLDGKEPIVDWVKGGGHSAHLQVDAHSHQITEFESPKRNPSSSNLATSEIDNHEMLRNKRKKRNLVDQMKRTMARYSSSVRMFPHDYKRGLLNEESALYLWIFKCGVESGGTWTLSYDIKNKVDRWIIFRPKLANEIIAGACIKLFPPWQEVTIPTLEENVTICTDFYVCVKPEDLDTTDEMLKKIKISSTNKDKLSSLHTILMGFSWLNMVPYAIKNKYTIKKQTLLCLPTVHLDVVVYKVWKSEKEVTALVKDSDNLFSILSVQNSDEEISDHVFPGQYIRFQNLGIVAQFTLNTWLPIFSVLAAYGSYQKFCYKLSFRPDTTWVVEMLLDISYSLKNDDNKTLDEIKLISDDCDYRCNTSAKIVKVKEDRTELVVEDDVGTRMRVTIISSFESDVLPSINYRESVTFTFLRYCRGVATMDQFSSLEQ